MKRGLARQTSRFVAVRSTSGYSKRLYAVTTPNVDEIQFQVVTDASAPQGADASRPFPTRSRRDLEEGVKQKANQTRSAWEAKFSQDNAEGTIFKDILQLSPYDEASLKDELDHVTKPRIQPTVDTAFNTKNHNFLTEFLASRTASYLEDPTLYFSYGENPTAALSPNWASKLRANLQNVQGTDLVNALSSLSAEIKQLNDLKRQAKKSGEDLLQRLQADADLLSNKELFAKTVAESGMNPLHVNQMTEIVTTDPLAARELPILKQQLAEIAQHDAQSPVTKELNELVAAARGVVQQLQASGLQFDASKVSF